MKKSFKEKVQSLSAKEIIMAMVEGLKDPVTEINMSTFGMINNGVCYGCAATNTICKIGGYSKTDLKRCEMETAEYAINTERLTKDGRFVWTFESAIDFLRKGDINNYNSNARIIDIAPIKEKPGLYLPELDDFYTSEDLEPYIELANYQKS